ncbi:8547_t:CDS:2, partial [Cetraspora pellucida]
LHYTRTPFDLVHSANTSTRRRYRNRTPPPTYDGVSSIPSMNRREFTAGQRDRSASPTRRVPSRRDENTNRDNVNNLGGDLGNNTNNVGGNSSHNANDVGRDSGHSANYVGENSGHNVDDTGGDLGGNLDDTTYEFSSDLTNITSALNISASQNTVILKLQEQFRLPKFPNEPIEENSLPFKIGSNISIKNHNKFLESHELSGYKFEYNDGNIFIIDMCTQVHEAVVALLQRYFNVPNGNEIADPPILVSGQPRKKIQ